MFVGLVHDPEWQPPEESREPNPRRSWDVPWRALAWLAVLGGLLKLEPVVEHVAGAPIGYAFLVAIVALGVWRFDRWCGRLYWRGLQDYQQ